MMPLHLTSTQKAALAEWKARTNPSKCYAISQVFSRSKENGHYVAMRKLVARGLITPGIPGGDPLREVV